MNSHYMYTRVRYTTKSNAVQYNIHPSISTVTVIVCISPKEPLKLCGKSAQTQFRNISLLRS